MAVLHLRDADPPAPIVPASDSATDQQNKIVGRVDCLQAVFIQVLVKFLWEIVTLGQQDLVAEFLKPEFERRPQIVKNRRRWTI
jgi:hypothetical protein